MARVRPGRGGKMPGQGQAKNVRPQARPEDAGLSTN
jgi:hypothetical protein